MHGCKRCQKHRQLWPGGTFLGGLNALHNVGVLGVGGDHNVRKILLESSFQNEAFATKIRVIGEVWSEEWANLHGFARYGPENIFGTHAGTLALGCLACNLVHGLPRVCAAL